MYTKEDLEKLTAEELKEILKKKDININFVLSKEDMILLILENLNNNLDQEINDNNKGIQFDRFSRNLKPNGVGVVGAIINIIFASLSLIPLFLWIFIFPSLDILPIHSYALSWFVIIFFILNIHSLIYNICYLKGKYRVTAGIFGLFSSLIGGILVLASKLEKK